ncbi:MAG TPA: hydantoinase/oxoprolinase family protein [Pseudomonadales bacterium]|jgi:N-methylhydantoinase A|nr:hydantoinase/oxoprolinase family protein [Gammaproteobacteria bacterium]HIL82183.1 hydantoinase/oxoprolinase family protein [Pseudomonadales bacterium]
MSAETRPARLAVDIGGTFTDVVLELPTGERLTTKLLTTYDHPGRAVLEGITTVMDRGGVVPSEIGLIIHGTTLATNALIERRGANTALLTTEGHRDALEMAHEDRFEQYDINIDRPIPLVPRHLRLPVRERMDRDGNILVELDESTIRRHLSVLEDYEIQSVAIGYLHAFVNPIHEIRTREILAKARPDLSISLACEVAPEIREFERLSTACANAYVRPLMASYLARLAGELKTRGFLCPFLLMTSGGGLTTLDTATKFPIRLVESGPAGGAILAQRISEHLGLDRMLSFDMGGTTAKLCLIDDGKPLTSRSFEVDRVYRFKKGSGLPVRIPVIEMVEIGAGGGSIARIDKLKRIQVGPESAGSEPGPAAYDRGGNKPTVTDADIALGRVYPEKFAFPLNLERANQSIQDSVAQLLEIDINLAAFSISEVVDENMASAARTHAAEFGMDLAEREIVAFGGAAPLHAARLGHKLGATQIIIPPDAGVGSAVGFLLAPISYEVVRSRQQVLANLDHQLVNDLYTEMRSEALAIVQEASTSDSLIETPQAYMRYVGQGHELAIDLPAGPYTESHRDRFTEAFERTYTNLYGHVIDGVDIEILSWTLMVSEPVTQSLTPASLEPGAPLEAIGEYSVFDAETATRLDVPVYLREQLAANVYINGPALITEDQTTTVISSSFSASINSLGCIVLTKKQPPGENSE